MQVQPQLGHIEVARVCRPFVFDGALDPRLNLWWVICNNILA